MHSISLSAFLLFLLPQIAFCQATDSLAKILPSHITYKTGLSSTLNHDSTAETALDTGLAGIHYYDPVDRNDFLYRNTGALGGASFTLVGFDELEMGVQLGYNQYDLYKFSKESIRFFKNTKPFTHLIFLIGLKKEQTVEVTHSQNIGKKFNFGFHYLRYATTGVYVNQRTRDNDLGFTTTFDSKKRYLLRSIFILNNIRAEENGGVKETNIFEDTSFVSKELVKVELEDAENKQRDIAFHLLQNIAIGKMGDSIQRNPSWQLYHGIDVGREQFSYLDNEPDSAYYASFNNDDTAATAYQSEAQKVFYGTKLGVRKYFKQGLYIDVSSSYSYNIIEQSTFTEERFNYSDAAFTLASDTNSKVLYGINVIYSFLDYNKDDFKSDVFAGYDFGKAGAIKLSAAYIRAEPVLLFQKFSFGNIAWQNAFDKQSRFSAQFSYALSKYNLKASVQFNQIDGFAFWDENRLPAQHNGSLHSWVFEVRKLFKIKYFGFDNIVRVQLVSDKNLLRYPVYWGVHSLYYERGIFKDKLLTRVGIDIRYNTNYMAPGYFPLTGQFYLQNSETLSFYPALDLYLCFKIQTVRIFLKMTHLDQGMFKDKGYFNAYKYPATDRTFRFGVSWMFLD